MIQRSGWPRWARRRAAGAGRPPSRGRGLELPTASRPSPAWAAQGRSGRRTSRSEAFVPASSGRGPRGRLRTGRGRFCSSGAPRAREIGGAGAGAGLAAAARYEGTRWKPTPATAPTHRWPPSCRPPGQQLAPDRSWTGSSPGWPPPASRSTRTRRRRILHLLDDRHLVLATPTGSGKSLVATFLHFQAMAAGKRSFYTCPIKALVNEKFFDLCRLFGPDNVGMMTGDAAVNREAPIVCCTAEILMNLAVREADPRADAVVMDEFHYYGDRERGRGLAGAAAHPHPLPLPADVGHPWRHRRHRGVAVGPDRPRGGLGAGGRSARCRSSSSTARRRSTRPSRSW